MVRRIAMLRGDDTALDALTKVSRTELEYADTVFVVDGDGRLTGSVPLLRLLAAKPSTRIGEMTSTEPPCLPETADQERVASFAIHHGLSAVPIVDDGGRLIGAVPPAVLLDILRCEHVEDLHRLAGIQRETMLARDALEGPPVRRTRDRLPWLLVGLAGSLGAAFVSARFEALLRAEITIAFFVPAIVYLADAIGTQTETIVVRGLSVSHAPLRRLVGGELRTGLLLGCVLALVGFPLIAIGFGNVRLALAVAMAILVAGGVATTVGLVFPWCLARTGRDPALGSGPVATIVQDVLSLVIYFSIVELVL
jgi:magnesium transporter